MAWLPIRPTTASRRTSSREIRLVTLPLRVREVIALVVVQGKAQLAFVCSQMVLHKVRILKGGGRRGEGGARREKGGGTKGEGLTRERWRTWRQRWSTSTPFLPSTVVIDVSPSTSYATHKTYPMQHHKHRHHIISQHASQVLRPQPPSVKLTFAKSIVSMANARSRSRRAMASFCPEATPPAPGFDPTRFCISMVNHEPKTSL